MILQTRVPGSIVIQDRWINYTANYCLRRRGWLIAGLITVIYALVVLGGVIGKRARRRRGHGIPDPRSLHARPQVVAVADRQARARSRSATHDRGLPLACVLVVVLLLALTFLAKRTTFGRHVYAVGGNAEAARRAGINVPRIRILVFMISSSMAAVGGIILAANVNSVDLNFGGGTLLSTRSRRR